MARRGGGRRRNRGQIVLYGLSLAVVLAMVLGSVISILSQQVRRAPAPTDIAPPPTAIVAPTATPEPAAAEPSPAPPPPEPSPTPIPTPLALSLGDEFSFAVCGDSRDGAEVYQRVLDAVQEDGSQFLVHLGDMVPEGREDQWQDWQQLMRGFDLPFYPVPGNHDSPDGLLEEYLAYSTAPAQRYSLDVGSVHLSMLDSYSGALFPSTLEWLEQDLSSTDQPVKMLFFHHPPFDPDGTDYILEMGNVEVMSLAERHGVQYVFTGHIHAYAEEERNGVQYVATGGCGAPLHGDEHPEGDFHHYVRVEVIGEEVRTEVVKVGS